MLDLEYLSYFYEVPMELSTHRLVSSKSEKIGHFNLRQVVHITINQMVWENNVEVTKKLLKKAKHSEQDPYLQC